MKIAIESNDGVTLKAPYSQTMGYIVCDIESERIEKSEYINIRSAINKPNRKVHSGFRSSHLTLSLKMLCGHI